MAAEPTTNDSSPVDFQKHANDYSRLIFMLKWGAVAALIVGFLVMIIIAKRPPSRVMAVSSMLHECRARIEATPATIPGASLPSAMMSMRLID